MIDFRVICLLVAVARSQNVVNTFYCKSIATHLDCSTYPAEPQCGTDGVTYANKCEFVKAHCKDEDLHVNHPGPCTGPVKPGHQTGWKVAFALFCKELSFMDCPLMSDPICATDGKTYPSICEYEKAKCMHADLNIKDYHACH